MKFGIVTLIFVILTSTKANILLRGNNRKLHHGSGDVMGPPDACVHGDECWCDYDFPEYCVCEGSCDPNSNPGPVDACLVFPGKCFCDFVGSGCDDTDCECFCDKSLAFPDYCDCDGACVLQNCVDAPGYCENGGGGGGGNR